jgi:hypothetical protein
MKKNFLLLLYVSCLCAIISCEEKKVSSPSITPTNKTIDSVSATLTSLKDSADKAWGLMIKSDDQKINDLLRLLQEISYCKKYNAPLLDSLFEATKIMKQKRYQQLTMMSEEIDRYDEFTNQLIARTKYLARTTSELQSHPIAETLYNDIAKADNDVVLHRTLYDRFATEYNNYLEANKTVLGEKGKDFKKLPLFSLSA